MPDKIEFIGTAAADTYGRIAIFNEEKGGFPRVVPGRPSSPFQEGRRYRVTIEPLPLFSESDIETARLALLSRGFTGKCVAIVLEAMRAL